MAYGQFIAPIYSFARASGATQYAENELVAESGTAASTKRLKWNCDPIRGRGKIVAVRLFTDNEAVTAAIFNLHLYRTDPGTPTNGDNGAYAVASVRDLLATVACDMSTGSTTSSTDKVQRFPLTVPIVFELPFAAFPATAQILYGQLSTGTSGSYTPASGEVFEVTLEIEGC
jgi:hypothetical protein